MQTQELLEQARGWDVNYIQNLPGAKNLSDTEARAIHTEFLGFLSQREGENFASQDEAWQSFQNYRGTQKVG